MNDVVKMIWPWIKLSMFIVAMTAVVAVVYKVCTIIWNFIV
jgi:hypothetical protein